MSCGHTMLTARSKRGVEFPVVLVLASSPRPSSPLSDKSTFELSLLKLLIEVRKTDVTCSAQQQQKKNPRPVSFDNLWPRFLLWEQALSSPTKEDMKQKSGQLEPMGRPRGLNGPSPNHSTGLDYEGVHTAEACVCMCVCVCVSEQICAGCPRLMSPQLTPS